MIYHGYDKELFNENISTERIRNTLSKFKIQNSKFIIYVGAIQPRKNIETLIEAYEIIKKNFSDLKLAIAGDLGWQYGPILEKIKSTEGVIYLGKFRTKDLPALLRGAEAFVLPSLYEGFGLPAVEAMACGVPVIAANNSSLGEILRESGLLYKPNNPIELAKSLREVLENATLKNQLKERGLERVKDFSWDKCARETLDWLKS